MPLAYWCVLIAALMPLGWVAYAKSGETFDNRDPREAADDLPPRKRRAYAAHSNAYDNFPFFAAAVIVATTLGAPQSMIDGLAILYVLLRAVHGLMYIFNYPAARLVVYGMAMAANIAIFVLPTFK